MSRTVAEHATHRDAVVDVSAARAPRLGAVRSVWPTVLAAAVLLAAELAVFVLVTARRSVLTPVHAHEALASYEPTPLAGHVPTLGYTYDMNVLRGVFLALLAVMFVAYAVLLRRAERSGPRLVAALIGVAQVATLLSPLILTDVYNYIDFARLAVVHHLNPYIHPPATIMRDPLYHLTTWRRQPTSYGPAFTVLSYPLALLKPSYAVWALKVLAVAASLGCVALVYACARRIGRPALMCAAAFGLNPLILIDAVGGAHNDFLMMLLVLAGVYLLLTARSDWSVPAFVGAIGVKASAAPILLFALIRERRPRTVMLAGASVALLALATAGVFGVRAPGFTAQARVVTPLSLPDLIARAIGTHSWAKCSVVYTCARPGVTAAASVVLVAALGFLMWRTWRGLDWLTASGWAMVAVVLTLTSVMPWYIVWILPFAAFSRSRALHAATAAVTVLLIVGSVPATYLLVA